MTAWILTALIEDGWSVTLASLYEPDFEGVDAFFGTRLQSMPPDVCLAPWAWRLLLRMLPIPAAFLEMALMERFAARLHGVRKPDLFFSTNNEMRLPRAGLQYVHFPRHFPQRPREDYRWYHGIPKVMPAYRSLARHLAGPGLCPWQENLALANSSFIAGLYRQCGGSRVEVVHPPVVGDFPRVDWKERQNRMVAVGRIHRSKRVLEMIDVVRQVRDQGHKIEFWIVGGFDCDEAYRDAILARQAESDWIILAENPDRRELIDVLSRSRYGLHAMEDEHFGMGVAEMQEAGMIVFAPNSGGPPEILGHDSRVLFSSLSDAVGKIGSVLKDKGICDSVRQSGINRSGVFSAEAFCSQICSFAKASS